MTSSDDKDTHESLLALGTLNCATAWVGVVAISLGLTMYLGVKGFSSSLVSHQAATMPDFADDVAQLLNWKVIVPVLLFLLTLGLATGSYVVRTLKSDGFQRERALVFLGRSVRAQMLPALLLVLSVLYIWSTWKEILWNFAQIG